MLLERDRAENSLHSGARLKRVLHRAVVERIAKLRYAGVNVGKGKHFARERVEYHRSATFRATLPHLTAKIILGLGLDRRINRQLEARPRPGILQLQRRVQDWMAQ